ncbi:sentrin-specific protease 2-like [Chionomys nivalis]|uniref:sentrin-specific protease 2-like n=1 Tax=Chionomys nivalis TaxID=269649 RepID=UPI002594823B|nr:sentrin-specific protease 2-like [Chionomys nivalis]
MWHLGQCGMEVKPEASRQCRKRKHEDEGGTETESEALRHGRKLKRQEEGRTDWEFEEPSKAQKRLAQEQQDGWLQREQPVKEQPRKPREERPKQLKILDLAKGPQEQAVTGRKSPDGGKGRKRPYWVMEAFPLDHHRVKHQKFRQHLQSNDDTISDPPRAHRALTDSLKVTGCVEEHSHGSRTTKCDPKQSTLAATRECLSPDKIVKMSPEESSDAQKKAGVNFEERRRHHSESDLQRVRAQIPHSGSSSLLPNKTPVFTTQEKPVADQGTCRGTDEVRDITEDMEKEIKKALGPGPQEEVLSSAFKLHITRGDIQTLEPGEWLNDEVINFYMNLLVKRSEKESYPALHVFSTFFYPKLKHGGYSAVKRWTRAMDLFEKEIILVPIHQNAHWSLIEIDLRKQSIIYYDSMGHTGQSICETIFQYLQNESKTRRNMELNPLEWKQYSMTSEEIPQQLNGSDCGVFTCKYADYISRDQPATFSQQHMPIFRKRMVWEILHSHLL